jgi:DNA-binding response OmpR family regulator
MRLLLISNDQQFAGKLKIALKQSNYIVDISTLSEQGRFWARSTEYDLVIAEHPQTGSLISLCHSLRKSGKNMPLLVIIESLTSQEAVELFNCGVDDYTSKFNHCSEIAVRVKALLRRAANYQSDQIKLDDLILDCISYTVARGKRKVHLTKKEFGLLEYMLRHPDQVLSRTDLIEHV